MSRTVIVGDVHGCSAELEQLLDLVGFQTGDRLIFVGDLIARGPHSLGVLDIARRTGAVVIRGNHEAKILAWRNGRSTLGPMHLAIANALRPTDWTLFENTPLYYDLPEHGVRVVHGGIDPTKPLDLTDEGLLTRIRFVRDAAGQEVLWGSVYSGPPHIVFGHNAIAKLQLHRWATGLDTGCAYGGRLTALVLSEGQTPAAAAKARELQLVSVPAKRVYFDPKVGRD